MIHQIDGYEWPGELWRPGVGGQSATAGDRMSCSLIFGGAGSREDRTSIPLFSRAGGVVLRPGPTEVLCAYSDDGGTQHANCKPPGVSERCVPGCTHVRGWCDPEHPVIAGWCRCSIGWCQGRPQPWRPEHLDVMMAQFAEHGHPYQAAGGYQSGYNEVIVDAAAWQRRLPHTVEAFFFVEGGGDERAMREAHAQFLDAFGLEASQVPLLRMRPWSWDEPFV